MAIDVTAVQLINAPRAQVASYATDPANDPEWIGGISKAEWVTEPPLQVGSQVARVAQFMGKTINYVLEVREYSPDALVVMESTESPFPMKVTYAFEDSGEQTQASVRVEGEKSGFFSKLMAPLMAKMVKKNITQDLERLKSIMES